MAQIESFSIKNLHNKNKDIEIIFSDNTLILVGENGSGKTTILQCFFYFLSRQWAELLQYSFDECSLKIRGIPAYTLTYREIENYSSDQNIRFRHFPLPPPLRRRLEIETDKKGRELTLNELEKIADPFEIPAHYIFEIRNYRVHNKAKGKITEKFKAIINSLNKVAKFQILYLPTYRRIEQELGNILRGLDDREFRRIKTRRIQQDEITYVELIEFGMKDVEQSINNVLAGLNNSARIGLNNLTSGYLADIIDEKYNKIDTEEDIKNTEQSVIDNAIGRIHDDVLSYKNKRHISETIGKVKNSESINEHEKVICHYLTKLMQFQRDLQLKEQNIIKFCEVCNQYLEDKFLDYDQMKFALAIHPKPSKNHNKEQTLVAGEIKLQHLSSGEKQIVSLFSHLYLSGQERFFVIIDEPELSLSVSWQQKFLLDIKNSDFCAGIFAVTHSPFIFDNALKAYAHGINEFIT